MPKVSIIVPVYNVEKYIEKCLNSLVNQTLEDIEIIVVNDGSPDNSQKIIDEFESKYPNKIKKIIKENGGQGSARNEGLKIATGEYIGYVDSDDYVKNNMYEKMYESAILNDSDIVIVGNYVLTEDGRIIKEEIFRCNRKLTSIEKNKEILFDNVGPCNKIYKTSFLKQLNMQFRCKKWYEDFDFIVKVLLSAKSISIIEEPLYYYLLREGSTMNNSNVERNLEILEAMDEIIEFCRNNNIFEKYYSEVEYLAVLHIYIPTIVRIIRANADKKIKKEAVNSIIIYMNKTFKNYKENKYIKKYLSSKKKIVYWLIRLKMYNVINIMFKLYHKR